MNLTTISTTLETLLNKPITAVQAYYMNDFDRLTKQIYIDGKYYQLYCKNGIITSIISMKQK